MRQPYQIQESEKEYVGEERENTRSHARSTTTCNGKGTLK